MSELYKKPVTQVHLPPEFSQKTIDTIERIESNLNVVGVMYIKDDTTKMCTLPESMSHILSTALPRLSTAVHNAITEIDLMDEAVAFRIETRFIEIMAATDTGFTACTVQRVQDRKRRHRKKTYL